MEKVTQKELKQIARELDLDISDLDAEWIELLLEVANDV